MRRNLNFLLNFSLYSAPSSSLPLFRSHCLAVLEIKEKRVGHKMKADLGPRIQEINADRIVAVGESTGSDPVASEARLLRSRFEDSHDLGGSMFPDQVDPA